MNRIMQHLARLRRARGGIAAVEFAIVLPLLVLMMFGTIEIGRILFDYQAASKSVRDATRYLTRIDAGLLGLACPGTINGAAAAVIEAKNLAMRGTVDTTKPFLLGYWTDPNSVQVYVDCVPNDPATYQGFFTGVKNIPNIEVRATVPLPLMNGWLIGQDDTLTFTVSHKEVHFGQ
jgi:Flp pilus assembly protein TadG